MPKHIVRIIFLIVAFLVIALIAKWFFTVDSFYQYGHYRGDSVAEIAAQEPVFQTPAYCVACHAERHAQWSANSHKSVICENCHGAAQGHPQNGKLPIPQDKVKLCTLCHEAMPGRPRTQPQIEVAKHSGGQQCTVCHNAHAPKISSAATKVVGSIAAGKQRSESCAGCHGETGIASNPAWPNLAGQKAGYLANALKAFKAGLRKDPTMAGASRSLSDTDIANLAAYYSAQVCTAATQGGNKR